MTPIATCYARGHDQLRAQAILHAPCPDGVGGISTLERLLLQTPGTWIDALGSFS